MKRYFNPNTNGNSFDTFREGVKNEAKGFIVGGILAPISLLLGFIIMGIVVLVAFGQVDYWGITGKIIVGVTVPLIIFLCFYKRSIGNMIFIIWSFILTLIVVGLPLLAVLYICFKPVFEYLGF